MVMRLWICSALKPFEAKHRVFRTRNLTTVFTAVCCIWRFLFSRKSEEMIELSLRHWTTGGIAARASEINTETAFALTLFNTPKPTPIEELLVSMPHAGICLVDHQQVSQLNKSIDVRKQIPIVYWSTFPTYYCRLIFQEVLSHHPLSFAMRQVDRIVGVIDHHALQNATIVTDKPIYIDIRPWGSMSTSKRNLSSDFVNP